MCFHLKHIVIVILLCGYSMTAQNRSTVKWIGFEELYDSIQNHPKKVFIEFYAEWCMPCKKMEKEVFTDPEVSEILNEEYYAVKMDVETSDTIQFGPQIFVNERLNRRNPVHQIALLMARRKNQPFSLPAMVILDEKFEAKARYFQFLNQNQLVEILRDN
jgi:thioredoxin-related protein